MQIYWLSTAKNQRINLIDYILINSGSVEIAVQVNESIDEHVEFLEDNPKLGKPGRRKNTREWVHPQYGYIVVYQIMSKRIEVLNILRGRQVKLPPK